MKTNTWSCDGVAKNGQEYPNCNGPHPPYENYGTNCIVCGLPKEAQQSQKTIRMGDSKSPRYIIPVLFGIGFVLAIAVAFGAYKFLEARKGSEPIAKTSNPSSKSNTTPTNTANIDPRAFVSATATNPQLISQGEKILLTSSTNLPKTQAATAFAQKHWDSAITQYQQAIATNPNDPESKIYLNNAKAEKAGNLLTIAVSIPISPNPDASEEVLRGVALAQDQFNQFPAAKGRLLEVVLVNQAQAGIPNLAQDLIKSPQVLGVIEQGIDTDSRANANLYQQAGLAVISPVSTSVSPGTANQSMLKTIPASQKANELAEAYLQQASTTLAKYANQKQSSAATAIFYDSSSPYSQEMKGDFTRALGQAKGKVVKEVDINASPNFNPRAEIESAEAAGAKTAFLAIGRNKVEQAVAIAQANIASGAQPLQLIGGDQLYEPNLLIKGGDAIKGVVLAVPWSWQPNDPFAARSTSVWKGRVSWRTATAHDATGALASVLSKQPTRSGVVQQFNQGVILPPGTATNFSVFNQIPLVQAVKGSNGPQGSKYEFDPI